MTAALSLPALRRPAGWPPFLAMVIAVALPPLAPAAVAGERQDRCAAAGAIWR